MSGRSWPHLVPNHARVTSAWCHSPQESRWPSGVWVGRERELEQGGPSCGPPAVTILPAVGSGHQEGLLTVNVWASPVCSGHGSGGPGSFWNACEAAERRLGSWNWVQIPPQMMSPSVETGTGHTWGALGGILCQHMKSAPRAETSTAAASGVLGVRGAQPLGEVGFDLRQSLGRAVKGATLCRVRNRQAWGRAWPWLLKCVLQAVLGGGGHPHRGPAASPACDTLAISGEQNQPGGPGRE